jgi:predicted alpha/beta-fold hydrolase
MGMGCRDLTTREADQQPDTAGRAPNYAPFPSFQPLEIPLERGPPLTGHHSTGAPGAPVVMVIHGLFDSHVTGYAVEYAESLRRMGFHVVALDLRDHGRQLGRGPPPSLGIEEGRDLFAAARIMSRAEGVSVGLLGMSYGAHCVVRAAHEATLAGEPEVLRGGVLAMCGPLDIHEAILGFDDHTRLPHADGFMDRMIFSELMKVLDRHLRLRSRGVSLPRHGAYKSYVEQVLLPAYPEQPGSFDDYLELARSAQPSVLGGLAVPTAIVHPVDDPLVPVLHARRAREAAGDNPYVHVIEPEIGGHIGLAGVDGPGTLRMLATWFGRLRDG